MERLFDEDIKRRLEDEDELQFLRREEEKLKASQSLLQQQITLEENKKVAEDGNENKKSLGDGPEKSTAKKGSEKLKANEKEVGALPESVVRIIMAVCLLIPTIILAMLIYKYESFRAPGLAFIGLIIAVEIGMEIYDRMNKSSTASDSEKYFAKMILFGIASIFAAAVSGYLIFLARNVYLSYTNKNKVDDFSNPYEQDEHSYGSMNESNDVQLQHPPDHLNSTSRDGENHNRHHHTEHQDLEKRGDSHRHEGNSLY